MKRQLSVLDRVLLIGALIVAGFLVLRLIGALS